MSLKRYKGICYYHTSCSCIMPVNAENKEDALKKLKDGFKEWNENWIKMGGNPKELIKIEIEE